MKRDGSLCGVCCEVGGCVAKTHAHSVLLIFGYLNRIRAKSLILTKMVGI